MKVKTYYLSVTFVDCVGKVSSRTYKNVSKSALDYYAKWYDRNYLLSHCRWSES